jgi:hypothetical protein
MRTLFALALLAAPAVANAADYDIPWFVEHSAARLQTLKLCHDDYRLARTPTCENAEAAATRVWGSKLAANDPMTTMKWWVENPISRRAVLMQCARRGPGDEMQFRWCKIAAEADAIASK